MSDCSYIFLFETIDEESSAALLNKIAALNSQTKTLYLLINTSGGSVSHGIALYNILRALPFDVITHNIGNVDSIGNVIFLAGKKRYAVSNATFMIHPVKTGLKSRQVSYTGLSEKLSSVDADNKRIKKIILEHCSIPQKELDELFIAGEVKTAPYALEHEYIHEIRDIPSIQPDNIVIANEQKGR